MTAVDRMRAIHVTEIAAFLIAMGERCYYVCGSWENSDPASAWLPVFDLPLGAPLSNATLDARGVWRREFASGTRAEFDTNTNVGRVFWAALPRAESSS